MRAPHRSGSRFFVEIIVTYHNYFYNRINSVAVLESAVCSAMRNVPKFAGLKMFVYIVGDLW